jgi:uncharacterized protein involved in response to NO
MSGPGSPPGAPARSFLADVQPYRMLFPLGAAGAIAGVLPWITLALGRGGWPGMLHASVMMQGFELAFVTGFLLTAMPAFTHGPKCRPWELALTALGVVAVVLLRFADQEPSAHAAFALTLAFATFALGRRVRFGAAAPPEEFAMVAIGMALGIAGGVMQALSAAGLATEPSPRFGLHLVSRGMMLAVVLGLGGLLVPTFALVPDPLRITGVARAGERPPRRAFVAALALLIAGAMTAEALQHPLLAAWIRVAAAAASLLLAWKLWRFPGKPARLPWALWSAGALTLLGLFTAAIFPAHEIAAWHITFIGGYGLLTIAIATRVTTSHGGHGLADEARVLGVPALACLALALLVRIGAGEVDPRLARMLAIAAALWSIAWTLWLAAALPRVFKTKRALMMPGAGAQPKRS